tara:strand:- start:14011 stop:15189 length:1179 start_codon:yes stop_codon:yes gene_type:complete
LSKKYKITIVGAGYVGMSMAVLLAQKNEVLVFDIDDSRVNQINQKKSTVDDPEIEHFLSNKSIELTATSIREKAYENPNFVIVATPTDFVEEKNKFDTTVIEKVVEDILKFCPESFIVIKSTVPIGYTKSLREKYRTENIIFSPEFLREGRALADNLYPSRIIIGDKSEKSKIFGKLLIEASLKKDIDIIHMSSTEAESVKLFSNAYLAMRVSFFNELDSFSITNNINTKNIIDGLSLDPRIGNQYNNPSFGYGGYCLPKDTKQLSQHFKDIPSSLITTIETSNEKRKNFIAQTIIEKKPKLVGIYRLVMKEGSDNFRESSIQDVIGILKSYGIDMIIFEPRLKEKTLWNIKVTKSLKEFKDTSEIIICNRISEEIYDVRDKIFTRDIFKRD